MFNLVLISAANLQEDFDALVAKLLARDPEALKAFGVENLPEAVLAEFLNLLVDGGLLRPWVELFAQQHFHTRDGVVCPFHTESLLEHSLRAALLGMVAANHFGVDDDCVLQAGVCGFLHDAGKVYAGVVTRFGKTVVGYPAHDIYGALAILVWWLSLVSKPEWINKAFVSDMCHVVSVHMCGTHSGVDHECPLFKAARPVLGNLTPSQKELLAYLRVGDTLGSIPEEGFESKVSLAEMIGDVQAWQQELTPEQLKDKKGIFISLLGFPCNGKSSAGRGLASLFKGTLCSRDEILTAIGRVTNPTAENHYQEFQTVRNHTPAVTQANQVISALGLADKVKLPKGGIPMTSFKGKQKPMSWNQFADWICREWGNSVLSKGGVFILDTVGSIVGNFSTYPEAAKNAARFNLYCKSLVPLTDEDKKSPNRCGIPNLEEAARSGTMANPMATPPSWGSKFDGQTNSLGQRKPVFAATSENDLANKHKSASNPHYAFVSVWDGETANGFDEFLRMVQAMTGLSAQE